MNLTLNASPHVPSLISINCILRYKSYVLSGLLNESIFEGAFEPDGNCFPIKERRQRSNDDLIKRFQV